MYPVEGLSRRMSWKLETILYFLTLLKILEALRDARPLSSRFEVMVYA